MNFKTKTSTVISVLITLLIVSLVFYTYPWADDYGYFNILINKDIIDFAVQSYNGWDGRSVSIEAILMFFTYKYVPVQATIFLKTIFFILSCYLTSKISNVIKYNDGIVFNFTLLLTLFFIGLKSSVAEVIFWVCGGYIYSFLIIVIFLYLIKSQKEKYAVFISFFLGMAGPNNFLIGAGVIGLRLLFEVINEKKFKIFKISYLMPVCIGFLIILLAPGNTSRGFELENLESYKVLTNLTSTYILYSLNLIFDWKFFIALSFLIALFFPNQTSLLSTSRKIEIIGLIIIFSILLIPFAIAGVYATRSFWPNAIILFLLIQNVVGYVLEKYKNNTAWFMSLINRYRYSAFIILQLFFIGYLAKQHYFAYPVYQQYIQREEYIKSQALQGVDELCIYPLDFSKRSIIHSSKDISNIEYLNFIGEGMEKYYQIDSIYICNDTITE